MSHLRVLWKNCFCFPKKKRKYPYGYAWAGWMARYYIAFSSPLAPQIQSSSIRAIHTHTSNNEIIIQMMVR